MGLPIRLAVGEKQRVLLPYENFTLCMAVHMHLAHQLLVPIMESHSSSHSDYLMLFGTSQRFPNELRGTTKFDHPGFAQTPRLQNPHRRKRPRGRPTAEPRSGRRWPRGLKIWRLRAWAERIGRIMEMKTISIFCYCVDMNSAIALAALTAISTFAGGALALKAKDRLHLVLGLSAGLLLGLVAFDLLPEVFALGTQEFLHAPTVSIALIGGFLLLHFYERIFGSHEPAESDYGHDHEHSHNFTGAFGAIAMGGHVFLDGLALGVAFKVSSDLGLAVFIALLVHAFSDGLNTVSFMIKSGLWGKKSVGLLGVDALARVSGAALGSTLVLNNNLIALYLAAFSGIVIYLATSHILPEAHSRHSSRWTMAATIAGVLIMWGLVAYLHSGDSHTHSTTQDTHVEETHDDHAHEDHE